MDKKTIIARFVHEAHEKGLFNGTWLYAEHGEIVSKGALGFRDAEDTLPMTEDSIFEMASVTKQFTAAAIMLLVRAGKLELDEKYARYVPEYPYPEITVRHLLTHTSGMPHFETEDWVGPVWENEGRIPSNHEVLRFIRESSEAPVCPPGGEFRYTDVGYTLLAELVERVSGVRFEDFLKKNLFEPAGMRDTGIFHTRRDGRPSDRFTRNLCLEDGVYVPSDRSRSARYVVGSDGLNGCDYAYTTIFDLLAWDKALREERVLTRGEQAIMYTPARLPDGEAAGAYDDVEGYGFGWEIMHDPELGLIVCHSGGMPGLSTWLERFADADRLLVVLNCREPRDARGYSCFFDGMRAIARGKEPGPIRCLDELIVENPDKSGWDAFCGSYDWEGYVIDVYRKDGDLFAIFRRGAWKSGEGQLYPLGEKTFGFPDEQSDLIFGDGCLRFWDAEGKKLSVS